MLYFNMPNICAKYRKKIIRAFGCTAWTILKKKTMKMFLNFGALHKYTCLVS